MNLNKFDPKILISVVTVVYNGSKYIEETIQSVLSQSYLNIEYIIIDGGSTDGTVEIINSYSQRISKVVVEKDNGIYDAMNKSLQYISGSFVLFMNAGDKFYSPQTISNLMHSQFNNASIIYGGVVVDFDGKFDKYIPPKNISNIFRGMIFSHQSALIKSNILKSRLYDLSFRIASDYDFFLGIYISGETFFNSNEIVSVVINNGLSDNNHRKTCQEKIRILKKYNVHFSKFCYLYLDLVFILLKDFLKVIFPSKLILTIKKCKS